MTDNHDYSTPEKGAQNWHEPLNQNFEDLDADVEVRDASGNLSEYDPEPGAKYLATDTGVVYIGVETEDGDGDPAVEWQRQGLLVEGESLASNAFGAFSLVLGGLDNRTTGDYAAVLGGRGNVAGGRGSVAAGVQAEAIHDGAVVFGDHTSSTVRSRASGELRSQMPVYAPAFYTTSTRASKTDLAPVDPQDALDGVEDLSVRRWELDGRGDDGPHVGPMAEEFHEQFDLGGGDSIATVDADGVTLAAIQGLAERLDSREKRLDRLEAERDQQAERIDDLRTALDGRDERIAHLAGRLATLEARLDSGTDENEA